MRALLAVLASVAAALAGCAAPPGAPGPDTEAPPLLPAAERATDDESVPPAALDVGPTAPFAVAHYNGTASGAGAATCPGWLQHQEDITQIVTFGARIEVAADAAYARTLTVIVWRDDGTRPPPVIAEGRGPSPLVVDGPAPKMNGQTGLRIGTWYCDGLAVEEPFHAAVSFFRYDGGIPSDYSAFRRPPAP